MQPSSGRVTFFSHDVVRGWAVAEDPARPAEVEIFADGRPIAQLVANRFDAEAHAFGQRDGLAGFMAQPGFSLGPSPVSVRVALAGGGPALTDGEAVLQPLSERPVAEHLAELEAWLDERFSTGGVTEDGIYFAHQPVYGFRVGPSEANWYERYLITYSIMRCLAGIEFSSLLDAGGAEGYKAALARALFGCAVTSGDLSHQACLRARELYGIDSQRVDLHALPHDDESWDVVLASETLEHVFDHRRVIDELLRVARSAVVITVPHESPEHVAMTVKANEIHGHIHYFDTESFDAWRERGIEVVCEKILATSNWTALPGQLMECVPEVVASSGSRIVRTLGRHPGLARALFGKRLTGSLLERDPRLAARPGAPYRGVLAVLYKDPSARRTKPSRRVRMRDILDFRTPRIRPNLDGLPPRRFGP